MNFSFSKLQLGDKASQLVDKINQSRQQPNSKLVDLDFHRQKFIAAHFLLISELNQKLSQVLSQQEYQAYYMVIVRAVRAEIENLDKVEANEILGVLDEKITPVFYPFVFSTSSDSNSIDDSVVPFAWNSQGVSRPGNSL